jgi:hypothetical protein
MENVLCYRNPIIARDDYNLEERAVIILETIIKLDAKTSDCFIIEIRRYPCPIL